MLEVVDAASRHVLLELVGDARALEREESRNAELVT
jgi:hypothetical protein